MVSMMIVSSKMTVVVPECRRQRVVDMLLLLLLLLVHASRMLCVLPFVLVASRMLPFPVLFSEVHYTDFVLYVYDLDRTS